MFKKFQVGIIKLNEAYCRSYIWSGNSTITKRALIAWDTMCLPKSAGGLNLINIQIWNKAAIAKTCWDLAHKADKLWIRWIHNFYIQEQSYHISSTTTTGILDVTIKMIYLQLIGERYRVPWKGMMFANAARPKRLIRSVNLALSKSFGVERSPFRILPLHSKHNTKGKTHNALLLRLVYTKFVHAVWMERNQRTFEDKHKKLIVIEKEIAYVSNVRVPIAIKAKIQQLMF
ncbi:hypothetical protein H5410_040047 [Solanum commersonii]|uniref:Uncharacterized protein n=1 Tax=Solanum commersonii TaxID=4109 RepID=A0A9J5XNY6_SOLCO|nr:hypothetical protein H5410_040047 [Solanum commersonii]